MPRRCAAGVWVMTEIETQSGWWQASDGNWYPPQSLGLGGPEAPAPAPEPSWVHSHRKHLFLAALIVLVLGSF